MLEVQNLSFGYGDQLLFENVNFRIATHQKVGLVGANGAGKTTLLNLLLGKGGQSSGKVLLNGTAAYVPQEIKRDVTLENIHSAREYADPDNIYNDHEILKLFSNLELAISLTIDPKTLSGGQKTKLALARAMLSKLDILLLDEPTNFMDIQGKKWVMDFLSRYQGSVVCISHDLDLMGSSIDKVLFLNAATKTIEAFTGNYFSFKKQLEERERLLVRQRLIQVKHIASLEKGLKKMARANKFTGAKIKQIHRIEKAKEELPDLPPEIRKIKIKLPDPANVGELPIRAINISKKYNNKEILKNISLTVHRGERIALIGPNGAGKSTFIKILIGMLKQDHGEVIRNETLSIGYYSQEFETFDMSKSVLEVFIAATHKNEGFARAFLGRYNFLGEKVFQIVETLSGGEKTRLSIACLTGQNHNLLILDEPTTYLDVLSQKVILESVKEYKGAMLIVSHTPEFLVELAPAKALLFPEEKLTYWDNSLVEKVEEKESS